MSTGRITPVAVLAPVQVGDVTISAATLFNSARVSDLNLHIGDIIEVARAGDVIPYITKVVKHNESGARIVPPTQCPVCGGPVGPRKNVDGTNSIDIYCLSPDTCPAQSIAKIKKWISSTGIMDVGDSVVEALVEAKLVEDPADLYLLTTTELQDMPFGKSTYGIKRAGKVVKNIGEKRQLPLNVFLGALGVTGLGEGVARNVREKMPGRFDKLTDWVGCTQIIDFAEQISLPNTARTIYDGLEAKRWLVQKLLSVGVSIADPIAAAPAAGPVGPLSTCIFCFTGSFSQQKSVYKAVVLSAGGGWEDDVRGNVTHVVMDVVPSDAALTGKGKKARAKGIPLISIEQFTQMLRGHSNPVHVTDEADDSYGG